MLGAAVFAPHRSTAQQIEFSSTATARYQGGVDASQSVTVNNPGNLVPVTANAISDPAMDGFSFAEGFAEGQINALGATLRSTSYASGFSPSFSPPQEVRATSSATASTSWVSQSQSLTNGTPIQINFLVPVSGSLAAEQFFTDGLGPNDVFAEASAELFVNGVIQYSGSARSYDSMAGGMNSILDVSGAWAGDFVSGPAPFAITDPDAFFINTFDVVSITANLGEVFDVDFALSTSAYSVGPFETIAVADFGSTGSFELSAVDPISGAPIDVTFASVAVPEPGTGSLALLASAMIGIRRRRR
tara:strand:- start:593459 stop:594367 length:909 start_codon:yes stop_codon:yes gene_type:complete